MDQFQGKKKCKWFLGKLSIAFGYDSTWCIVDHDNDAKIQHKMILLLALCLHLGTRISLQLKVQLLCGWIAGKKGLRVLDVMLWFH